MQHTNIARYNGSELNRSMGVGAVSHWRCGMTLGFLQVPLAIVGNDVIGDSPVILDRLLALLDADAAGNKSLQALCKSAQDEEGVCVC